MAKPQSRFEQALETARNPQSAPAQEKQDDSLFLVGIALLLGGKAVPLDTLVRKDRSS